MNWLNGLFKNQKGVFLVFTAVLLPIIFACAGLAMDLGNAFAHKSKLQNAADAAALAGAKSFSINKGEEEGKDNEKDGEHPKSDETAMKYAIINYQKDIPEANTDLKIRQKDGVYYYRVYLKDYVPVTFMRILGVGPTMEVSVDAIATVPQEGNDNDSIKIDFGQLMNIGSEIDGGSSFYNNNGKDNDEGMRNNKIQGSTFDGKVVIYDENTCNEYKNNVEGRYKFFTSEAIGEKRCDAITNGHYTEPISGKELGKNYTEETSRIDTEIKGLFAEKNKNKEVAIIKGGNGIDVFANKSNYYEISGNNLTLNLTDPIKNGTQADKDTPVYIYINEKETYQMIKINLREKITRPVIIYYAGTEEIQFEGNGAGYFRGVVCAPNAKVQPFNFDKGEFYGSVWAKSIKLNSQGGARFHFEAFGDSSSGSSGGSSTGGKEVKLKLVDGSGLTWK